MGADFRTHWTPTCLHQHWLSHTTCRLHRVCLSLCIRKTREAAVARLFGPSVLLLSCQFWCCEYCRVLLATLHLSGRDIGEHPSAHAGICTHNVLFACGCLKAPQAAANLLHPSCCPCKFAAAFGLSHAFHTFLPLPHHLPLPQVARPRPSAPAARTTVHLHRFPLCF